MELVSPTTRSCLFLSTIKKHRRSANILRTALQPAFKVISWVVLTVIHHIQSKLSVPNEPLIPIFLSPSYISLSVLWAFSSHSWNSFATCPYRANLAFSVSSAIDHCAVDIESFLPRENCRKELFLQSIEKIPFPKDSRKTLNKFLDNANSPTHL
jgi:hypothetical protein